MIRKEHQRYPNRINPAKNWIIFSFEDYYKVNERNKKHKKVERQTQTKNNLIFEKRTQPSTT